MKKSFEKKYTLVFSLLVAIIIFVCWLANALLISKYYISRKLNSIQNMYEQLDTAATDYGTVSEQFNTIFESNTAAFACDILVLDQDMNVLAANVMDESVETERLLGYFFDKKGAKDIPPRIIEKTDKYTMQLSDNLSEGGEYLELWGVLSTGNPIVIRSAVSGINNNARLANILLAYIGIIAVIISFFMCKFAAKIVTKNTELELELKKRNELDEMRKDFLNSVSHELKTPIALIQGYAEGLVESVNDDEESKNFYCEVIIDETAKMNSMVKSLLELNELEFGDRSIALEKFDVIELIRNCISSFDVLIKQNNINLEFMNQDAINIISDELKIEQVFNNYLSNAIHYAAGDNKTIRISVKKTEKGKVRVCVYNSGDNISQEALTRIWDKFYKVDKARTREYGGSGVGLSIVKASMDALNQKYGVVNCKDGVEFWFEADAEK